MFGDTSLAPDATEGLEVNPAIGGGPDETRLSPREQTDTSRPRPAPRYPLAPSPQPFLPREGARLCSWILGLELESVKWGYLCTHHQAQAYLVGKTEDTRTGTGGVFQVVEEVKWESADAG